MANIGAVPARLSLASCTFSDSDKLEYEPGTDSTRARLKYIVSESDDFADLSGWDETDSGGNVALAAGVVSLNGNGNWNANGLVRAAGVSRAYGYFEWKEKGVSPVNGCSLAGPHSDKTLTTSPSVRAYRATTAALTVKGYWASLSPDIGADFTFVADTWYTFRLYLLPDANGNPRRVELSVQGGVYTEETVLGRGTTYADDLPATLYFHIQRRTNDATKLLYIKEWRWYTGYATDSPTVTLADVDSGRDDSTWDMSTIALAGSTTNLTFKYAYGNSANPTNWSSALTYAQLIAESDVQGRYFRLQIIAASDGATQVEITEGTINVGLAADFPAVTNVQDDDTVDGAAGTLTLPAAADVQSGVQYGGGGTEFTGTFTEPGVANVKSGVQYGGGGTEFTGTGANIDFPDAANVLNDDTVNGAAGTYAGPAAADVQSGVQYGAGGTEFTGTFTEPGVANVESGVQYGGGGTEFTGTFTEPGVANVRSGTTYGGGGTEFTGTMPAGANLDINLTAQVGGADKAYVTDGDTVTFAGGLTPATDISGCTVSLKLYSDSACTSLVETLISTTADLTSSTESSWATINGSAVTWDSNVAPGDYFVKAAVSGGNPDVGTLDYTLALGVLPSFNRPTCTVADDGDGTVTITIGSNTDANGDNQVARIYYQLESASTWARHSSTKTGNGTVTDLGSLTDSTYLFYACAYDAATGIEGAPSDTYRLTLDSTSKAQLQLVAEQVASNINALSLTTTNDAGSSISVSASLEIPPIFDGVTTACVKVFYDAEPTDPAENAGLNRINPRVNVAYCHKTINNTQEQKALRNRERIRDTFVGSRLSGLPTYYCTGETSPTAVDLEKLYERFAWISVLTLEFTKLRARG